MGQYVGIDLHRRSFDDLPDGRGRRGPRHRTHREPALRARPGDGGRWARARGRLGIHLWLVLGGRRPPRPRRPRAPRPRPRATTGGYRRVKNDKNDGTRPRRHVAHRAPRRGLDCPTSGPRTARARALSLFARRHRTSAKAQIHGVMAKNGILPVVGAVGADRPGPARRPRASRRLSLRLESLRQLLAPIDREIDKIDAQLHHRLKGDLGYRSLMSLPGVGQGTRRGLRRRDRRHQPVRLAQEALLAGPASPPSTKSPTRSCTAGRSPSGLGPRALGRHRGGGQLPGQGRREAARRLPPHRERRGKYKARVAVARKQLTLVYYGLRDGEVRCLDHQVAA